MAALVVTVEMAETLLPPTNQQEMATQDKVAAAEQVVVPQAGEQVVVEA